MKAKKLKISVIVFLSLILLIGLAGCKSNKEGTGGSQNKQSNNTDAMGYPITKDPITLRYWMPMNPVVGQYIQSLSENEVYQEMEKITGIKIEFMHPASGQESDQFNLMVASGDIPDIITGAGRYKGGIPSGVSDGVYLDLTPYLQKYAPDYYSFVNSNLQIKREAIFDEGKFFAFFKIKKELGVPFNRIITRKDWLSDLGKKEPWTINEWETYLKDLKDKKNVESPLLLNKNGMDDIFMGAFNIQSGFYLKDGKKVDFGQIQPEFKEYLAVMNRWYSAGYISKDFASSGPVKSLNTFTAGKAGVLTYAVGSVYNMAKANNIDIATAPFPRLNMGDKYHFNSQDSYVNGQDTVVSNNSKYKLEAIRWLNYAYTKDGEMLFNYGIKDKTYTMVNGKPTFTDYALKNPNYPPEAATYILRVHAGPKLSDSDIDSNLSILADGQESINNRLKWSDDKGVDSEYALPPIRLNDKEQDIRAPIMTDVNNYVNEMVLKFITGQSPLSMYDEYVNNVRKLGINEAIKVTQDAYERYMKVK